MSAKSTKWTRRFVDLLIGLFVIAGLAALIQAFGAYSEGKFHMVSYPASSENIEMIVLDPGPDADAFWQLKEGTIRVDNHSWLRATRLLGRLAVLGLLIGVFWQLRGMLTRVGQGDVFNDENIASLRNIGKFLLITSILSISITFMTQYAILDAIPPLEDRHIHPSISWNKPDVENIWLEYSPPIVPMLLAMVAFITAGAFKSGKQFREDSESVV
ncbi:DUF2975 domain-containing protein [Aurantiacibacter sp. D1-12]|uniref:DUF2975 domain-containing protein n=1 Tax=Aurantiacibacter sp. D1-12 TaxID=2993658 RepID=UPI00237C636C|nr:DUF2975 domain-containing protein [Aurantiacibacter sp. D1-12]MDE1466515.1 DUF2975 domain-containing protein [Aurantiacibacter sp. D1-12]